MSEEGINFRKGGEETKPAFYISLFHLTIQFVGHYTSSDTKAQKKMNIDATSTETETKTVTPNSSEEEVVVQYVVLRRDLIDTWPLGSVVTQGCHASVAAIWQHKDDPATLSYCSPSSLDSMHK
ncbi:putative peptidyl-tRNA hydrolase PTRHD1, partial [Bienertia sinuspersici]